MACDEDVTIAVSYTHLDVYKRQGNDVVKNSEDGYQVLYFLES